LDVPQPEIKMDTILLLLTYMASLLFTPSVCMLWRTIIFNAY